MQKTLSLLLAVLLLVSVGCCAALAETQDGFTTFSEDDIAQFAAKGIKLEKKIGYQPVYLPVTVITHDADGNVTEAIITPQGLMISYGYWMIYSDALQMYVGGSIEMNDTFPTLTLDDKSDMGLNISCERVSFPIVTSVETFKNTYTMHLRAGVMNITYDEVIHINQEGIVTSREPTTVQRAYYFTETGP